ncbi:GGDEF domain-containing protein [Jatrophihabitans sp. GAS493]|uniref:GGDEF domain-containing protein n=1 Tax=Jatrophihabitans sp. GAS493 TaxID=1907575 RepID=UPI0012FD2E1A|nr:GGDEF domain-containing protein [Jatrophihabitans sp. GAS493]
MDLIALTLAVMSWASMRPTSLELLRFLSFLVFAFLFEEIGRSAARLLHRVRGARFIDMTSVWMMAAIVVLSPGLALIFLVAFRLYLWFRQLKSAGLPAYRQIYTCASVAIALVLAQSTLEFIPRVLDYAPRFIVLPIAFGTTILVFMFVNTALVAAAIRLAVGSQPIGTFVGTIEDNLIELATLCLGALVAFAALREPTLVALGVPLTIVLQRAALVRQLEDDASMDPKTGLLNAPTWHRIGVRELARAEREREPVAVLLLDLDHFKAVNDGYGHLVGDQAILAIADLLRDELRDYDSVGRFGGEEFVALLPRATAHEAFVVAERIRQEVRNIQLDTEHLPAPTLSLSIGLACFPDHGVTMDELLQAADTALYRAKNSGRNKVVVSSIGESGDERVGRHVTGPMPPLF